MNIVRHEIRTGLLVVLSMAVLSATLITIAAPGLLHKTALYRIYFDDAGGIQSGAAVMLSGRRVGQVRHLISPVPENERPDPKLAVIVEVEVKHDTRIHKSAKATMLQYGLLGDQVIDFSAGSESSGLANSRTIFIGERQPGLNEVAPKILEQLDPVLKRAASTLEQVEKTASHLATMTAEGGDLNTAIARLKTAAGNLEEVTAKESSLNRSLSNIETMTGKEGSLSRSLSNLETLTSPEGKLASTFENAESFTSKLANNDDLPDALENIRKASAQLDTTLKCISPGLNSTSVNAAQFTDTIKRQPWRLFWPTTKRYPDDPPKPRRPLWATPRPKPLLIAAPPEERAPR